MRKQWYRSLVAIFVALYTSVSAAQMTCESLVDLSSAEVLSTIEVALAKTQISLSEAEGIAVDEAHKVGRGEAGKNGQAAGLRNYSFRQILRKARILKAAGLSSLKIRKLMDAGVVGELSQQQIRAAFEASKAAPTFEIEVRQSASTSLEKYVAQYAPLESPSMQGKKVLVHFYLDYYDPGSNVMHFPVPQMVLTRDYLDPASRGLVKEIESQSLKPDQSFQEVGGWIAYTDRGVYRSQTMTSHDTNMITNEAVYRGLDEALLKAQSAEGRDVKFVDIEFYHTHLEKGEAFSNADYDFLEKNFRSKLQPLLTVGGRATNYAIPVKGNSIFSASFERER